MGMKFIKRIPSADEIKAMAPLTDDIRILRDRRDGEIKSILRGDDNRFILVVGPCSADNDKSVYEYLSLLAKVEEEVRDELVIIPRIYTNKPRTTGEGYKGMMHQPDPEKAPDLFEGIKAIRKLHIKALSDYGLPAADEMLYPGNYAYLDDVLAYHTIGARSIENQLHRLTVSGISAPVGMKNPTGGDLSVMLNSIQAAQHSHSFIYNSWEVETDGNPFAHGILRGFVDASGRNVPNYHYEDLIVIAQNYIERGLQNPALLIDANHSNSGKKYYEQPRIVREILMSRRYEPLVKKMVKGLMVESYLVEGAQDIGDHVYGKSITDPCLGWEDTRSLIYYIAENHR